VWQLISLQIIVYDFMTIYGIATKFGYKMCCHSVFQISRQSDNAFAFYDNVRTFTKRRNSTNFRRFLSQKYPSWNLECEVMTLANKNCLTLWKFHKATYTWKLHYFSSCYELMGVVLQLLGLHNTQPWAFGCMHIIRATIKAFTF